MNDVPDWFLALINWPIQGKPALNGSLHGTAVALILLCVLALLTR